LQKTAEIVKHPQDNLEGLWIFEKKVKPMPRRFVTAISIGIFILGSTIRALNAQILPPESASNWKSRKFMIAPDHALATPFEKSNGKLSASPKELVQYLELLKANPLIKVIEISRSPGNQPVFAVIASTQDDFILNKKSDKPLLLFQGGIHAGEIDGLDAGLMIMRDLGSGRLRKLLENVNVIFIPVINPDGHARLSSSNRINQRGPEMMGWRANSLNQNLNRDYMKIDCPEIQSVLKLIQEYGPDMYVDIHVTDGTDYQYDITYGWNPVEGYSPGISHWMNQVVRKSIDLALQNEGHVPGPLIFQIDSDKPEKGITDYVFAPRFSNAYGDAIHLPSILVENHSLKSFDRRVCGTYVFLEALLNTLVNHHKELRTVRNEVVLATKQDLVVKRSMNEKPVDSLIFKGVEIEKRRSALFNYEYSTWNGKATQIKIPVYSNSKVLKKVPVANKYIIPPQYTEVIEKLKMHGIQFIYSETELSVTQVSYKLKNVKSTGKLPFQGRTRLETEIEEITEKRSFPVGSVIVETSQEKGFLAAMLLEPEFEDSFFSWGFFSDCLELTEYFEIYAMVPLAERMALENRELKMEFDKELMQNEKLKNDPEAQIRWWYEKSEYFDRTYLKYPVGIVR
jgi:hypothetical protein